MARARATDVRAGGAYVEVGGDLTALDRSLTLGQKKLRAFTSLAASLSKQFLKAGALLATPFGIGTKVAADFSEQMAMVATMLSGDDLRFMERYKLAIRKMSVEFGESTGTLAKGLYDILSASIPASQALDVLEVSAKAAKAGLTDTGTSADAITTILNSFKLGAEKAADVADFLFGVVKRGKTTYAELAPSIGLVASTASVAGLRLEEMGALLATMTRNGVKTRIAITALRAILNTFLKPQEDSAKAAKRFGFDLNSATLRAEGFLSVMQKLQRATPEDIAKIFPNIRAMAGVAPALQDMNGYLKDLDIMYSRAGSAQEAYSKMSSTLAHKLGVLKQAIVDFFREIGLTIMGEMEDGITAVTKFINGLKDWVSENRDLVKGLAKLSLGLIAVGTALAVVNLGTMALIALWGPLGLMAVVLATTGVILEALGVIDVGLSREINNFRIGSLKLNTWMNIAWLEIKKGWDWTVKHIELGWVGLKGLFEQGGFAIWRGWNWVMKELTRLTWWMVEKGAEAMNWMIEQFNALVPKDSWKIDPFDIDGINKDWAASVAKREQMEKELQRQMEINYKSTVNKKADIEKEAQLELWKKQQKQDRLAEQDAAEAAYAKTKAWLEGAKKALNEKKNAKDAAAASAIMAGVQDKQDLAVAGTFSAFAASNIGAAGVLNAQLDEQKKATDLLSEIARNTRSAGAVLQ